MTPVFWIVITGEILAIAGLVWVRYQLGKISTQFSARKVLWLKQLSHVQTQARRTLTSVEEQKQNLTNNICSWQKSLPKPWQVGIMVFRLALSRQKPASA